jgi:hypothetical protein
MTFNDTERERERERVSQTNHKKRGDTGRKNKRGGGRGWVFWLVAAILICVVFWVAVRGCDDFKWTPFPKPPIETLPEPLPPEAGQLPADHLSDPDADGVNEIEVPATGGDKAMEVGDLNVPLGPQPFAALTAKYPTIKGTKSTMVNSVIAYGNGYYGRPYVFGSNRTNDKDFDCSDFTQWIYKKKTGLALPLDSRSQRQYIEKFGSNRWNDLNRAQRGDLLFFMSYKGTSKSAYPSTLAGKKAQTTTHVGIYLGNGQMMHTASPASGGVRIDSIRGKHWEYRWQYSGSVLTKDKY